MILYFTGTGNTQFIADCLAEELGDCTVSLNAILRSGEKNVRFESEKPYIICFPVYAWNIPPVLRNLLEACVFSGRKEVYFVATMGVNSGNTHKACRNLAKRLGLEYRGYRGVVMPDNYVVKYTSKTPEEAAPIIASGAAAAKKIASCIARGEVIQKDDITKHAALKTGPVNAFFVKKVMTTADYTVSETCTRCGACVDFCPLNNISLQDDRVLFGDNCTACYGCIHRCPVRAIEVKGKTEENGRYLCPTYEEWKQKAE